MEEAGSEFYLFLAGRQAPRAGAKAPTGGAGSSAAQQADLREPLDRPGAADGPVPPTPETLMFSVRLTEATSVAIARAAKAAGKTQRQFLAELLAGAGVAVHPVDLRDRPNWRPRA
ncbi:hypothetical protein ACFQS7_26735 [Dankookia sp. GCM10030260]|uniref:hypothetical protein n=1 Tax=Dankookia sp. GCM10030260 TaxID=3273390 RepID=UPI00361D914F